MNKLPPETEPVQFVPRARDFTRRVNALAVDTRNVRWSQHARERMEERDIPIRIALNVLRQGSTLGPIEPGQNAGEWKAKLVLPVRGRREVGVAVLVVNENRIFVKTVEWEDIR